MLLSRNVKNQIFSFLFSKFKFDYFTIKTKQKTKLKYKNRRLVPHSLTQSPRSLWSANGRQVRRLGNATEKSFFIGCSLTTVRRRKPIAIADFCDKILHSPIVFPGDRTGKYTKISKTLGARSKIGSDNEGYVDYNQFIFSPKTYSLACEAKHAIARLRTPPVEFPRGRRFSVSLLSFAFRLTIL